MKSGPLWLGKTILGSQFQLRPEAWFTAERAAGDAFQFFHVGAQGDVGVGAFLGRFDGCVGSTSQCAWSTQEEEISPLGEQDHDARMLPEESAQRL